MGLLRPISAVVTAQLFAAGCVSDIDVALELVEEPRVLAVQASPAETRAGGSVTLSALYADGDGTIVDAPLAWALCSARKPLAELGPIAEACREGDEDRVVALGEGTVVDATIPAEACRSFGPEPPPAQPGQPAGRPVDPDVTGGYYQPVSIAPAEGEPLAAVFGVRLSCGISGATQAQAADYNARALPNAAPEVAAIERRERGAWTPIEPGDVLEVEAGANVGLRVRWPACSAEPECGDGACTLGETKTGCAADCDSGGGCGGAEHYLVFDREGRQLRTRRESMSVAWFTTAGSFAEARTGRAQDDLARTSDNAWTAPDDAGDVTLWVVLRDARGAASWRALTVRVN